MNRFHVHLNVTDLAAGIRFYTGLFGMEPTVRKDDYAKWMVEDPCVNFAISSTGRAAGIDHLGIQADSGEALTALGQRLDAAGDAIVPEKATVCCYARSDKLWTQDPQGTRWEAFHTLGEATTYHAGVPCTRDATGCSPDLRNATPDTKRRQTCCAPDSACC